MPSLILQVRQDQTEILTEEIIFDKCKAYLLQNATLDSIFRIQKTKLDASDHELVARYFDEEYKHSLQHLLKDIPNSGLAHVTTFSTLLSESDKSHIGQQLGVPNRNIHLLHASQFRTEKEFSTRVDYFFASARKKLTESNILIVQVELLSSHDAKMVDCIKFILQDRSTMNADLYNFKICMLIQLPRIAGGCLNGFPCHPWKSYHLDQLSSQEKLNVRLLSKSSLAIAVSEEINYSVGSIMISSLVQEIFQGLLLK